MDGTSAPRLQDVTWDTLFSLVEEVSGVSKDDIKSQSRYRKLIIPRTPLFYLARMHTRHSYPWIGRRVGDRDHTTVLFGFRNICKLLTQPEDELKPHHKEQLAIVRAVQDRIARQFALAA